MANSNTYETMLICWKGTFPKGAPKERQFVDAGSSVYEDTLQRVPILPPKDHAYVSKEVFEQSLKSMIGNSTDDPASEMVPDSVAEPSPGDSVSVADSAADQVPNLHESVKKSAACTGM